VQEIGEEEEEGGSGYLDDESMGSEGDSEEYVSGQPQPSMSVGTMCSRYVKRKEEGLQVTAEVADADEMGGMMAAEDQLLLQQQRRQHQQEESMMMGGEVNS